MLDLESLSRLSSNNLLDALMKNKADRDNFYSNPINKIGSMFVVAEPPKVLTANDLFGGPATKEQENQVMLYNSLIGNKKRSKSPIATAVSFVTKILGFGA